MVFRGKPSKGCQTCRERRIRCDRKEPGCGNCARAARSCPGYRNQLDLMFHDETAHVQGRHSSLTPRPRPRIAKSRSGSGTGSNTSSPPRPSSTLSVSDDLFALCYCYDVHIIHPHSDTNTTLHVKDEKTLNAMRALGMATYSNLHHSQEIASKARRYYVSALQAVNAALASPKDALDDQTLFSIVTLTIYETTSGVDGKCLQACAQHVRGLSILLEQRGSGQLISGTGRLLFLQVSTVLLSMCLRTRRRTPAFLRELVLELSEERQEELLWRNHVLLMDVTDLLSDTLSNNVWCDPYTAIDQALGIDKAFMDVFAAYPSQWAHDVVPCATAAGTAYPGFLTIYKTSLGAQLGHSMRVGRMWCYNIIVHSLHRLHMPPFSPAVMFQIRKYEELIWQLQMELLSAVPQAVGLQGVAPIEAESARSEQLLANKPAYPDPMNDLDRRNYYEDGNLPVLWFTRGQILVWQLGAVGETAAKCSAVRKTTCKMLRLTAEALGISLGFVFAASLEQCCRGCEVSITRYSSLPADEQFGFIEDRSRTDWRHSINLNPMTCSAC